MDLDLRYVVELARTRHFTRAADFAAGPLKAVRELERDIGTTMFFRTAVVSPSDGHRRGLPWRGDAGSDGYFDNSRTTLRTIFALLLARCLFYPAREFHRV